MRHPLRRTLAILLAVLVALVVAACTGDDGDKAAADAPTPAEVLDQAKGTLDETPGLRLSLTTDDLPDGVTGITSAVGVATKAPAFDGTIKVVLSGTEFEVPVVAVDDKVYAQIPLTPGYSDVDPAEYGAPDPAGLITSDHGFSSLLPVTTAIEKGESVRGGADNSEVLTSYTGAIPGDAMKKVIPSASGETFDATYLITDDGELREAELTGVFYPDSDEMTYTVTFDDYGTEQSITAP
ncbi:LppX_LprAFG lipoprotein [Nocardioides sp. LHG3406-4]|uniref:LppX_LprAFG lipoprotein n=1 Tax=Nocardioides sp. LHG3406-4 TaxID=2804575 RepID=UPI003CF9161A